MGLSSGRVRERRWSVLPATDGQFWALARAVAVVGKGVQHLRSLALMILCGLLGVLPSVEVAAEVISVIDGDALTVCVVGTKERVRFLYVDIPESKSNSQPKAIKEEELAARSLDHRAKAGSEIALWGAEESLERDWYTQPLVVVVIEAILGRVDCAISVDTTHS